MRVLYCAIDQQVPGTKGGSIHVRAVAEGLAALGHEVHVATQPGAGGFPSASGGGAAARVATRAHAAAGAGAGADADAGSGADIGAGAESGAGAGVVRWHAIGAPFGHPNLRLAQMGRVKSLARTVKPDIVIERYHNFGGEGLLAARDVEAPAMLEVNAPIIDYPGSPKRRLDRLLLIEPMRRWRDWQCRAAARIISPSRAILPAWVPAERVIEAEWGADTNLFRPRETTRDGEVIGAGAAAAGMPAAGAVPDAGAAHAGGTATGVAGAGGPGVGVSVVFAGAFRAWHGVQHLMRAMRQLHDRGRTDIRAVLIGDGPELPAARSMAAGLDTVTFTGALPHEQVASQFAAADIGVAPFDLAAHAPLSIAFYWSPLKVFEYLASGLPVVAPDIPRLRDIIAPGTAGLLYDAQHPEALASTLLTLADDAALRARLGAAARERAVRLFSWESHCRLLDTALREMLSETGRGRAASAARDAGPRHSVGVEPAADAAARTRASAARGADAESDANAVRTAGVADANASWDATAKRGDTAAPADNGSRDGNAQHGGGDAVRGGQAGVR